MGQFGIKCEILKTFYNNLLQFGQPKDLNMFPHFHIIISH